ncbi:MAG: phage tail length tape measure family protein, partial [Shewanella oncorhynchi]
MANRSLSNLTLNLIAETGSFSAGMDSAERSLDKVARAAQKQKNDLVRLMGQIDPLVSEYAKLDKMERQLQKHRETGTLAGSEYDLYAKRLATMRSELGKTGAEYDKTGMSAKQMAFATRGLPAQFTDIAVSLQGGQNPMTVFLQQGGQLKDMFGGVGPAAKAMGGYIAGLVNPFTVGATAAGVMALAYYQGSIEADRLRNALILTGNSAGTTSDELMDAAKRIDAIIGTQRQAAAALAEVANTGKFTASQIELVGRAAIQMENVTGKAIAETVAEFAKLADDPVKAAEELNKKYNFLTASVYEQIVALKESGKTTEAAELAFNAYSAAIDMRTKDITANLGRIEGAWKSVKEVAAEGWDATIRGAMYYLNGPDKKQELAENAKAINELIAKGKGFGGEATRRSDELERLQARGNELVKQIQFGEQLAKQEAERAKISKDSIAAQRENAKLTEETLTNEQKRTKAIKEYKDNIEKIRKDNPSSALLDPDTIKRDLASIEEKFKDTAKKTKAFADDAATTYL